MNGRLRPILKLSDQIIEDLLKAKDPNFPFYVYGWNMYTTKHPVLMAMARGNNNTNVMFNMHGTPIRSAPTKTHRESRRQLEHKFKDIQAKLSRCGLLISRKYHVNKRWAKENKDTSKGKKRPKFVYDKHVLDTPVLMALIEKRVTLKKLLNETKAELKKLKYIGQVPYAKY